jgi:hypothetical protein
MTRRLCTIGLVIGVAVWGRMGQAASKAHKAAPDACVAELRDAEARTSAGHLLRARELLRQCASATCAGVTTQPCAAKLARLEDDIPTIVPVVTDAQGGPVVDVEVRADGELVASRLDGRGLAIDPGLHELSFSAAHGVFATERLMIVEGQRNRAVAVTLPAYRAPAPGREDAPAREDAPVEAAPAPDPQPAPEQARARAGGPSVLVYVLGGAGLASLGAGALLTYWGNKDNEALSACSPYCFPQATDHVRALYIASDVAFGAGAAALGLATFFYLRDRARPADPPRPAATLDVVPTRSGAFASVKGVF